MKIKILTMLLISKEGVQGLQGFAFWVVMVDDEHTKSRFKRRLRG